MFGLGWQETVVIFVLALLLFGPKKLPELGKNLAKALGEFRRASNELKDTWQREMAAVERETQDLKREAESLGTTVASATTATDPSYNYDYNYEYGGYGYPDSSPTEPATQGAAAEDGSAVSTPATPEGVVPSSDEAGSQNFEAAGGVSDPIAAAEPAQAPSEPAPTSEATATR